jgi:hypothetical protein
MTGRANLKLNVEGRDDDCVVLHILKFASELGQLQ